MKTLKNIFVPIYILIFFFVVIPEATAQQKYAILISAGNTIIDDNDYHSEYWYDMFLMYRMLIESGFSHNNIFVLYGNGNDFNSNYADYQTATVFPGTGQITDFAVSKANVQNIFTWLANGNAAQNVPQIQPGDFLFYWWMGHGASDDLPESREYHASIETTGEQIRDDEFAAYFNQLPACLIKNVFVMTCTSGGLIDDIEGLHMMAHTAADYDEYAQSFMFDVIHAEFSYHVSGAFRQQEPGGALVASDINGDGLVSVGEANSYAHSNTTATNTQVGDYRNIASLITISNAQPVSLVPNQGVYSRDYAEDSGTEPSDYMSHIWYEGPDLWVRNSQDGDTDHQNPEFGQTNYVYARVHNIGCNPVNVNVDLSWAEVSAWSNPSSWNAISTTAVNNLQSNETRVVSVPWTSVPAPGKYCMHTMLNAPGDPANADGRAYMDNNKVQINVTVADAFWGLQKRFHWLIENGLNEKTKVDVVIEKIQFPAFIPLELIVPSHLKFDRVVGGTVEQTARGSIIKISPKAQKAILQGVILSPRVKEEAVLSLITPKEMKLNERLAVRISERMNGKEMGGIVFNVKTATREKVLADFFRTLSNFLTAMGKNFNFAPARKLPVSFQDMRCCSSGSETDIHQAMSETVSIESKLKTLLARHMEKRDLAGFETALDISKKAAEGKNLSLFIESQEELMFSTKELFLSKLARRP